MRDDADPTEYWFITSWCSPRAALYVAAPCLLCLIMVPSGSVVVMASMEDGGGWRWRRADGGAGGGGKTID